MRKQILLLVTVLALVIVIFPQISEASQIHKVESGESLFFIAQKYEVTVEEIITYNNIENPNNILPGQELVVVKSQATETKGFYQVVGGDTLYKIAHNMGMTIVDIAKENNLVNLNMLSIGQILNLPEGVSLTTPEVEKEEETTFEYTLSQLVKMYPDSFYLKKGVNNKEIALTFDDGPNELYTPQVLDILKECEVPATFFLMGKRAQMHPEIVKRTIQEGHVIGNHSWDHPNFTKISLARLEKEINSTEEILNDITGLRTALIRPPYGAVSENVIEQLKAKEYKIINWSIDSVDWKENHVDLVLENTLPWIKGGDIVLFHDAGGEGASRATTVEALPIIIQELKAQGYTFVTVDHLLDIPAYKEKLPSLEAQLSSKEG